MFSWLEILNELNGLIIHLIEKIVQAWELFFLESKYLPANKLNTLKLSSEITFLVISDGFDDILKQSERFLMPFSFLNELI